MVCYDIRFPVWARNRYHDGQYDYDFAFYLANFPDSRMVVWNTLLVARAIENQAYIGAEIARTEWYNEGRLPRYDRADQISIFGVQIIFRKANVWGMPEQL